MTYEDYWQDPRVQGAVMEVWADLKTIEAASRELGIPEQDLRGLIDWLNQQPHGTAPSSETMDAPPRSAHLALGEILALVRVHFGYLFTDYDFSVVMDGEHAEVLDWQVVVQSVNTRVRFALASRSEYVCINMNPLPNPASPPLWLQAYDSSSVDLMEIVAWRTNSHRYLTYTLPAGAEIGSADSIRLQMAQLSRMLRQYAEPFLRGEFTSLQDVKAFRERLRFGGTTNDPMSGTGQ